MKVIEFFKKIPHRVRAVVASRPEASLILFVLIVASVSVAGYARYQYVQTELAAQQDIRYRLQKGFDGWRDDLSNRLADVGNSIQETMQGVDSFVGGALGIGAYVVRATRDFISNLYIMVPVIAIYFAVGFFGTIKMRVATLLGFIVAFWISTSLGIVVGSIIGLSAMACLLLLNKFDPRLLRGIQHLLGRLVNFIRERRQARPATEETSND
ncbi:MAG: hypothetical protein OXE95_11005 [Chloroflexi bacterium]|nr:hypothetical protein [Chloroflexota bacterium]MCY4248086.1 hypothetical protein [Chloroflexota bacterium]